MKINELIRYHRKKKKLTLIALAKQAGISYGMLYRLEDGSITSPNPELLKKISKPLDLEYRFLLDKSGYLQKDETEEAVVSFRQIPLLLWDEFKGELPKKASQTYSLMGTERGDFAIRCQSDDWHPYINEGELLVVSQTSQPEAGRLYIGYENQINVLQTRHIHDAVQGFLLPQLYTLSESFSKSKVFFQVEQICSRDYECNS